ncbi:glutamyl-tRNA amidotransferase [Neosynechococcus sphagnicola sy1]|uniref:Aspartyl/glutamyl-tRNA(Asn/Gln) amidotransferase subunit C n=1 Tax=Neosynechococcus sphagnicola sy1 TaxID=1497020 RepID=A0A098TJN2_9CYAN|nr:Asp-tRNA(Asn)/Glu-tRNA(Gln) amidotransferase subunit GatC [Neosynechococcus sphagnicola]KGF72421.1 glutamyl-tRNA amidotransferase [Neosynechococcus sphagnicola sy1]
MLDLDQVRKVAHLARLTLTPAEETQFTTQLSSILEYFQQLSELDTSDVQPTARVIDLSNVTRPDRHRLYENREGILASAPDAEGDFFRVPKIM